MPFIWGIKNMIPYRGSKVAKKLTVQRNVKEPRERILKVPPRWVTGVTRRRRVREEGEAIMDHGLSRGWTAREQASRRCHRRADTWHRGSLRGVRVQPSGLELCGVRACGGGRGGCGRAAFSGVLFNLSEPESGPI